MDSDRDGVVENRASAEEGPLPPVGEPIWVQCRGFRTLAYRDAKGMWRTVARGEELEGPIKVLRQ
jgi:hypothetical protein